MQALLLLSDVHLHFFLALAYDRPSSTSVLRVELSLKLSAIITSVLFCTLTHCAPKEVIFQCSCYARPCSWTLPTVPLHLHHYSTSISRSTMTHQPAPVVHRSPLDYIHDNNFVSFKAEVYMHNKIVALHFNDSELDDMKSKHLNALTLPYWYHYKIQHSGQHPAGQHPGGDSHNMEHSLQNEAQKTWIKYVMLVAGPVKELERLYSTGAASSEVIQKLIVREALSVILWSLTR